MKVDFRNEAAAETVVRMNSARARSLADLNQSGCSRMPGGLRLGYLIEIPSLTVILLCWVSFIAGGVLAIKSIIPKSAAAGIAVVGLAVAVTYRKLRAVVLRRDENFLESFPDLPGRTVSIEDAGTIQVTKFLVEDEGFCLFDAMRRRILIEGRAFRHVIYGTDIYLLEPISGYALGGARLTCRMGEQQIAMIIKSAGHGPLASLEQAFARSAQAANLTAQLARTLFGAERGSFNQPTLPPPLPPPFATDRTM